MQPVYGAGSSPESVDAFVARLAARQHGAFTREQAASVGATRHMVQHRLRTGRWQQMSSTALVLSGFPASWKRALMIACLSWGQGATTSHRAAAAIWSLVGFGPGIIELIVPKARRRRAPGVVHRNALMRNDATVVDAIPVTTPIRTLFDIAAVIPYDGLEEAVDDALARKMVSIDGLRRRLDATARSGRPGIASMRSILDARHEWPVPQSVFETRLLRLLADAGVPAPIPQYRVLANERLVAVVDFAWPELRLCIEADGFRWHSARSRFEHDRTRRNALTLLGWRVIHVMWNDLMRRPKQLVETIRSALATS